MKIPSLFSYQRSLQLIIILYAFIWIALEGRLWQTMLLALGSLIILIIQLLDRSQGWFAAHKNQRLTIWLTAAASGTVAGVSFLVGTLFLMALKTGLHAHGAEFTAAEIEWIWHRRYLWPLIGSLAGSGFGMLFTR